MLFFLLLNFSNNENDNIFIDFYLLNNQGGFDMELECYIELLQL